MPAVLAAAALMLLAVGGSAAPAQAVTCPSGNPVVNENACIGGGSAGYQMTRYSDDIGGFATKSSFNLGEPIPLKIGRNAPLLPSTRVNIDVYRMGDYAGEGGRRIAAASATSVTVNNTQACNAMDPVTGKVDCGNWATTFTIPAASIPATGVYVATLTTTDTGIQNQIYFVVRDDNRSLASKILFVLPTATYQAYNTWGGKSLYFDKNGGAPTISGTDRAVKVSFNRPLDNAESLRNHFFGPDASLVQWLESQGYDVSYTDDVSVSQNPGQLLSHKVVMFSGHSEYWSQEEYNAVKAARDAGVSIANVSSNTAYWKIRYEDGGRTIVCYKTVQGSGTVGSGAATPNDPGPDGVAGTADDALGLDGLAGTADDHPENATTTWRDNGALPGEPNAPPGGRVGPDKPENSLFGVMYVGDNEGRDWPLTVPAGNATGEFASDRTWRNTGLATNTSTNIGTDVIGWEWDAVPTQAQYLAQQPAGVKRLSATNVADPEDTWLQDEGRVYFSSPPAGQPNTVNAVRYRASSGAIVFSSGTNLWASAIDDGRISQATYNILSDMGVQPVTPTGITTDPAGSNQAPIASFSPSANPAKPNVQVTFSAAASTDPDGTITKYEWDLDGDGTYETDSGVSPTATKTYSSETTVSVHLRVTDNGGAQDATTRDLTILANQAPTAALSITPNPAVVGQTVTYDASGSNDPDGTIAKYDWDLDGNGSYETTSGTSPTLTQAPAAPGTTMIAVRVTDNGGKTATASQPQTVANAGLSNYGDAVLATPGLVKYLRMGESTGPAVADSTGGTGGTISGGTFGAPGGVPGDPNTAVSFNGSSDWGKVPVSLSSASAVTLEFWLKWTQFSNDDRLAMELTPDFNSNPGGLLVDPNAPQFGGTFGVALGMGSSRNTAFFARPTAGAWHHYAIVFDRTAPAGSQITPYVDGQPVAYQKADSGTGAPAFANGDLYLMSRAGSALLGSGSLDEVAVYNRGLDATTISTHAQSFGTNRRPAASFAYSPSSPDVGQQVSFDASGASDPDGSIVKYEWDLDGNGTFETNTGTTASATKTFTTGGNHDVSLRVTDNQGGQDVRTRTIGIAKPVAAFTATPNPVTVAHSVTFNASASSNPSGGSIVKYEWDLDGNGTYEVDGGTSATTTTSFATSGQHVVSLRVTNDSGSTGTTSVPVTVNDAPVTAYNDAVNRTAGLAGYWRLGEATGPALADSKGSATGTMSGGTFGVPGAIADDPNKAVSFNGSTDWGKVPVSLSSASAVTLEFWLNWAQYANDDRLAMELTPDFNSNAGGLLVDPNAPQYGGTFGIALGSGVSRNNAFFARPTAGAWHHYAIVFDRTAPAGSQITPYVDGQPVAYQKTDNGTGAPAFANSDLYLMSRAGSALLGSGSLDEVAVYNRGLDGATVADHFRSHGVNARPQAAVLASTTIPAVGQNVTFNASGSADSDGSIVKYDWDLNDDGAFETTTGATPTLTQSFPSAGARRVTVRVTDNLGGTDTASVDLTVGGAYVNLKPVARMGVDPNVAQVGQTVSFTGVGSTDADGSVVRYEWDLDGNGSYETDTGGVPSTSTTFATAGTKTVGLRVTDDAGGTDVTTSTVNVSATDTTSYSDALRRTAGLIDYWRMGEATGPSLADSKGTSTGTVNGGTFGVQGAVVGDPDGAVAFNGSSDSGKVPVTLSSASAVTVEFWLKWDHYADDDSLALELTPNFNDNPGGLLVDPNSPQGGGSFGVGMGLGASRNTVFFARPTAGAWHHYVLVFDRSAPAATAITPYVDGQAVSFTKSDFGTGAPAFADGDLYLMSRAGQALLAAGSLDELAIYDRALDGATASEHFRSHGTNARPAAALTVAPAAPQTGDTPTYDASASADSDGSISKYEWDLNGDGTYETSTGTTPTASGTLLKVPGPRTVSVRVTDDKGATDTASRSFTVTGNAWPTAALTVSPSLAQVGQTVTLNAGGSADTDGTIATYEWDLDGNGSYETNTGTSSTATTSYATGGSRTVGVRVTDDGGATDTASGTVNVNAPPTAGFTVSPNPGVTGQSVTFNAGASADTDGTIATYEWDLDGNGSYETNTGTTASATRTYTSPATLTIGLRVTDDRGGVATTTRALTVNEPTYSSTPSSSTWTVEGGSVLASAYDGGDTLYLGGTFTTIGPRTGNLASVSTATGTPSSSWADISGGQVNAIAPDGSGGFYVGGSFTAVGGVARANLAHLTSAGALDATFAPAPNGVVRALAVSGTTLYVGGDFTSIGGATRNRLAAVSGTTGAATTFNPNLNGVVRALTATATTLYVGGDFTTVGGTTTRNRLAAYTISSSALATWNPSANGSVYALTTDATAARVLAGGSFTDIGGGSTAEARIAQISVSSGAASALIGSGSSNGANGTVDALARSGSTLFLGGNFTTLGGSTRTRIGSMTLNPDALQTFNGNANGEVFSLTPDGSGGVYAGGAFTSAGGATRSRLAQIASTGAATAWNPVSGDTVTALATSGTQVLVGGSMVTVGGVSRNGIAALSLASGQATTFNPSADGQVSTLALSGTTLYAGGTFTNIGGASRNRLAGINVATGAATSFNPNVNASVNALALDASGNLYAGGSFQLVNTFTLRSRLAAWSPAGTLLSWNPGASGGGGTVESLAVTGTSVYVGGTFTTLGGSTRNRLGVVSTTGTLGTWNPNASDAVYAITPNGADLFVGGDFTSLGGTARNRVAAYTLSSGALQAWNPNANGGVRSLAVSPGQVYVGGSFTSIAGSARAGIAAISRTSAGVGAFNPALQGGTVFQSFLTNGALYLGGSFTQIGSGSYAGLAAFRAN